MSTHKLIRIAALLMVLGPSVAVAQKNTTDDTTAAKTTKSSGKSDAKSALLEPVIVIQHMRPQDKRGLNIFESPKQTNVPFNGFKLDFGAAFTQQFQALDHQNTASARMVNNVNQNQLMKIGNGFNNAAANLNVNAQLAPGIRVALTSYLSSRHHNETWVKDGYLLIDGSPIDNPLLNTIMDYVSVKAGHFEINYGDEHFRRSDNGNTIYNPFVGNLILDAFTTEVGAEFYLRAKGFLGMAALTGGEIKGNVLTPDSRSPAYIFKLGYDKQITPLVRARLTASHYRVGESPANTLYGGDRAGSRYFFVLENTLATSTAQAFSGLINPGFKNEVDAIQINPFVKIGGAEFFGLIENAKGQASTETKEREWRQYAVDGIYRFGSWENLYVGARYNTAEGELDGIANKVSVDRYQIAGGWFIAPTILLKAEYVNQKYNNFPSLDIRNGGKFKGLVFEGVVAF